MKIKQIPTWPLNDLILQLVIRDLFSTGNKWEQGKETKTMLQLYTELHDIKVSLAQLGHCLRYEANESRATCSYNSLV